MSDCCQTDNVADHNDFQPNKKKTRTQYYIYAQRDMEDGPLEFISLLESLWYHFCIQNFYINEDRKLKKAFRNHFCLPYQKYLELVELV